jgi:heme A synthase
MIGFSLLTTGVTFVLLLIGGLVNPTGSSLACPDWPTCYGSFFPEMTGGILFEHTHRLVATLVGFMTCVLAFLIWKNKKTKSLRWLGLTAVGLVIFQGLLGGITVLLKLPLFVSTAHLATSMIFFLLLIFITFHLIKGHHGSSVFWFHPSVKFSLIVVYLQIILGAFVRHTHSGLACGTSLLNCAGSWFPTSGPGQLHMLHRGFGLIALFIVCMTTWKLLLSHIEKTTLLKILLGLIPLTVILQVFIGILTVATSIQLHVVTLHLGLGALLLALLFLLNLSLLPNQTRCVS